MEKNEKKIPVQPFGIQLLAAELPKKGPYRLQTGVKAGLHIHSDDLREGSSLLT
jgi:hypothetical protein